MNTQFNRRVLIDLFIWNDDQNSSRHIIYVRAVAGGGVQAGSLVPGWGAPGQQGAGQGWGWGAGELQHCSQSPAPVRVLLGGTGCPRNRVPVRGAGPCAEPVLRTICPGLCHQGRKADLKKPPLATARPHCSGRARVP